MLDISLVSTHNNSRRILDKSQSILNQSFEAPSIFSEYSALAEYNLSSNINYVYDGFKDTTKCCSENNNYLKMIDDFGQTLSSYLLSMKKSLNMFNKSSNELSNSVFVIYNEIQTWKLIFLLYEDRFREKCLNSTNVTKSNVLHSELEVLIKLFQSNKDIREAQIVIDWLEFFMREKIDNNTEFLIGSHGKSWEHTKYMINKSNLFSTGKSKIPNELDPDAPMRGKLTIAVNDKNNEDEYLRYLFHCVQSGDIEKAKSVCQNHDELWRAQSLEGWKPFHNPLTKEDSSDTVHNDIIGNPNRTFFKLACQKLSENAQLNVYERAIYAIFCGNLQVLSMVEKDWSGLLWAHFKVYLESIIENCLKTSTDTGFFNTQSLFGEDDLNLDQFRILGNACTWTTNDTINNLSLEEIFDEVSVKLVHDPVNILKKGFNSDQKPSQSYYQSIFEMVQQYVILEDVNGLVQQIQSVIVNFPRKKSLSDKNAIRFLAHLTIFVYSIHEDLEIGMYHRVLEEYIKCLLEDKWLDNVAFYISKLSTDLQIKWYCQCLKGVTTYQERKKCVDDGLEYDLPIVEITRLLVESYRINENSIENLPRSTYDANFEDKNANGMFVTDKDKANIDALDWLGFLQDQQCHLVRQINAFCRTFLEMDKIQAAKMAMVKITDDIWSQMTINANNGPKWLASALYENQCLRTYIECHNLFGDWYNHFTCQKPADIDFNANIDLNKLSFQEKQVLQKKHDDYVVAVQQWEKLNHFHANKAFECFHHMLKMGTSGWLSDIGDDSLWLEDEGKSYEQDNDTCYNRKEQLRRLRKKCIVAITFMSMNMMTNSEEHEKCFLMSDLIADDRYRLYSVFDKGQLQKLLHKIKQCSLSLMSEGKDALVVQL